MACDRQPPLKPPLAGSRIPRPVSRGKTAGTPSEKTKSAPATPTFKSRLQHDSSSFPRASGGSEAGFALEAVKALQSILKATSKHYEHRSSTRYRAMLQASLSQARVWLEDNEKTAEPLYVSEVLAALEDLCRGKRVAQPRPLLLKENAGGLWEKYPELSKLVLKRSYRDATLSLDELYSYSRKPWERSERLAKQEKVAQRFQDILSKIEALEAAGVEEEQLAATDSEDDFSAHLSTLFTVLSRYRVCQSSAADIIPKISLRGYRRHHESGSVFDMLFPDHPHKQADTPCNWQNAVVHVGPEVTFDGLNPDQSSTSGIDYHEFCGTISGPQQEQLFLTVSRKDCKLHQTQRPDFIPGEAWMLTAPGSPAMSLRKILATGRLQSTPASKEAFVKIKIILSYLLVKGVWQFYDSELMPTPWTKDTVEFLLEWRDHKGLLTAGVFLNQPLISANFSPPDTISRSLHRYPKIQHLGIMLFEIILEKEFESFRTDPEAGAWRPAGRESPQLTDHALAKRLFKTKVQANNSIWKPLKDVIGKCLDDEHISNAAASSRDLDKTRPALASLVRKAIYDLLVLPLESAIALYYDEPFDLEPLVELDTAGTGGESSRSTRAGPHPHEQDASRGTQPETMVVHTELSISPADIKLGQRWLDDLDKVHGLLQAEDNPNKVRVVILDTGFSPVHGNLPYDIDPGKYKDFVDGVDDERRDLTGHGTTMARLIFQVLDEVDLYIARVFKSEKAVDESFGLLEQGIKWAVQQDADILVMATGTPVKAYDGVSSAINSLPDKVIVIAAAGNRDHCERVAFPARMARVMCTYATTARNYVPKNLNPNPLPRSYNFGILGVGIQPEEWVDTPPLTGTSYAAAIAAALAAMLLDFSRQPVPDGERVLNLEGHEKMNFVFDELASDNKDQGYSCIVPWRLLQLLEDGRSEREHRRRIREFLADVIKQRM